MDKVSVIVPVYNVEPYLSRCIRSLTGQTYEHIEILLIDDASSDESRMIIERERGGDERIRAFFMDENRGVSAARNLGLREASGEWVCFCDGDDWYEPYYVEKMLDAAKRDGADYVICGHKITSEHRPPIIASHIDGFESGCDPRQIIALGPISSWTRMIRRELFLKNDISYPVECSQYEELPVTPVLAKYASRIAVVHEPLYNYFQRGDGTSASNTREGSRENFLIAWGKMAKALGEGYDAELEYRAIYALLYGEVMSLCKKGAPRKRIKAEIAGFEAQFPNYTKNPYLALMGRAKRMFIRFCRYRFILGLRLLSRIHQKIVG